VQRKAHRNREKRKEHGDIAKEFSVPTTIDLLVHEPITDKEDNGANHEEAHKINTRF